MSDTRSTSLEMRRQTAKSLEPGESHSRQVRTQRPSSPCRRFVYIATLLPLLQFTPRSRTKGLRLSRPPETFTSESTSSLGLTNTGRLSRTVSLEHSPRRHPPGTSILGPFPLTLGWGFSKEHVLNWLHPQGPKSAICSTSAGHQVPTGARGSADPAFLPS